MKLTDNSFVLSFLLDITFQKIVHDPSWKVFKKRKKGKLELVISYCTLIVVLTGGDNAVGLSTDSHTNAVAV